MAENVKENNSVIKPTNSSCQEMKNLEIIKLNDNKAGMQGLDVNKINQIIEEASKGSKFYLHKQKNQEKINRRIAELKSALASLTEEQKCTARKKMDSLTRTLEMNRDLSKTIVHVDMDAFYAAVEMRDNPELKDKPMAVGTMSMLSTSNYVARRFGVRAAMPGFIAKKLCPDLVIVHHNFSKYKEVSKQVQKIFADYDPEFSAVSLDEAYLDLTNYLQVLRAQSKEITAASVVEEMRARIFEATQLTASAGIAPNAMLAKICSDKNKPNGQFILENDLELVMQFVNELPIRKVSGIGNVTEQLLGALDITTCKDLFDKRDLLYLLFSETSYEYFLRISLGLGSDMSGWSERERKSMSCETTFKPTSNEGELLKICQDLSQDLSDDLQKHQLLGKAVTLKYKTDQFDVKTKINSLPDYTNDADIIFSTAKKILLSEIEFKKPHVLTLRLLGVRMSQLCSTENCGGSNGKKQKTLNELFKCPGKKRKMEDDDAKDNEQPSAANLKSEKSTSFVCPVCNVWTTDDLEIELNRHIDECLNQQALPSMYQPSKRTKGQTKLDSFVVKKNQ